jgi:putative addiction module CopG family antidote
MGESITVSISGEKREFVAEQMATGNYSNEADVVDKALALLQAREKIGTLRALIAEGDTDIAEGRVYHYETTEDFLKDITSEEFAD